MATPYDESNEQYIRRMSDDGLGGLATPSEIADNISASIDDVAISVADVASLPSTATIRPAGTFTDAYDLRLYLERGGLSVVDEFGNTAPIGFVYVVESLDPILNEITWQVYIDTET